MHPNSHIILLIIIVLYMKMSTTDGMPSPHQTPRVIIAGGGPGGLMAAILLSQKGIPTTVLEQSHEPEQWSPRSYTISLNERGIAAFERANCLELAKEIGTDHHSIVLVNEESGALTPMPLRKGRRPGIRLDRPTICKLLESVLEKDDNVTLQRGAPVQKIVTIPCSSSSNSEEGELLEVHLEDGSVLSATHVIGADGKWSNVRKSCPDLESQVRLKTERSFSVQMTRSEIPEGWTSDQMHSMRPKDGTFYAMCIPLAKKELSLILVFYDEVLKENPWLAPPGDVNTDWDDWDDSFRSSNTGATREDDSDTTSTMDLIPKLKDLLNKKVPAFLSTFGEDALKSASFNHRISWIDFSSHDGTPGNFCTPNGRVALIGDAAHGVVPSTGEGCNMALESAVRLADSIDFEKGEETLSVQALSSGFKAYGLSRPHETLPIQLSAAAAANYATSPMK